MSARTFYDKLWKSHAAGINKDGTRLLYIDRHLLHEVTSPQPFAGLRLAGRKPWRGDSKPTVSDDNVTTTDCGDRIMDALSKLHVDRLDDNFDA